MKSECSPATYDKLLSFSEAITSRSPLLDRNAVVFCLALFPQRFYWFLLLLDFASLWLFLSDDCCQLTGCAGGKSQRKARGGVNGSQ
jgi:hypothetical protein